MSDAFSKVKIGDPFDMPVAMYNTIVDMANWFRDQQATRQSSVIRESFDADIVFVKNDSGEDCPQFGVLGIDSSIFDPGAGEVDSQAFRQRVAITGVAPTDEDHTGNFAILLQPLADGGCGQALVSGACHVKINVVNESDDFADIDNEDVTRLKSGAAGAAKILWKQSGTGEKWGYVRFGGAGSSIVRGYLMTPLYEAGDAGSEPTTATMRVWRVIDGEWTDTGTDRTITNRDDSLRLDVGTFIVAGMVDGELEVLRAGCCPVEE